MPTDKNEKPTSGNELRMLATAIHELASSIESSADSLGEEKIQLATNTFHSSTLERLRAFAARVSSKVAKVNMQKLVSFKENSKVRKKKP